ncbi:MAG: glutathione transferase GstA [Burkholderiales bacterium]|nr:glutathione transferase GstA [Burkholderiales bacterium]
MKLYYSPGACSLSPHIVAREAGIPLELVKVDLKTKTLADGSDYRRVNGKGYVPALELADGEVLTEGPVIVQYLADSKPEAALAPPQGTRERLRLQEWLNFITSELHKGYGNFFNPALTPEWRAAVTERLDLRLGWVAGQLDGRPYLMGERFSVADAYLFTVLNWSAVAKYDLARFPSLVAYHRRIAERPKVVEAMRAEGLIG